MEYKHIETMPEILSFLKEQMEGQVLNLLVKYYLDVRSGKPTDIQSILIAGSHHVVRSIPMKKFSENKQIEIIKIIFKSPLRIFDLSTFYRFLKPSLIPEIEPGRVKDLKISFEMLNGGLSSELGVIPVLRKKFGQYIDKVLEEGQGDIVKYPKDLHQYILSVLLFSKFEKYLEEELSFHNMKGIEALEQDVNIVLCHNIHKGFMIHSHRLEELQSNLYNLRSLLRAEIQEIIRSFSRRTVLTRWNHTIDDLKNYLKTMGLLKEDLQETEVLLRYSDEPIVKAYLKLQKTELRLHDIEFNLKRAINPHTGRITSEVHQFGTFTGRIVTKKYNYQYVPKKEEFRSCFVPASGNKLVIADYSQSELGIAADLSQDEVLIDAINSGTDLHVLTASLIFGKDSDSVTDEERTLGKGLNFGILYGMGARSLSETLLKQFGLVITMEEAQEYIHRFFTGYPKLKAWRDSIPEKGCYISRTRLGRRRVFSEESATKRWNTPIQSTGSDILKMALVLLEKSLGIVEGSVVGYVHDEIVIEVPEELIDPSVVILVESMETGASKVLTHVKMAVKCEVRDSWWK